MIRTTLAAALFLVMMAPAASAQCWDYSCEEETTQDTGGDPYCEPACGDSSKDSSFKASNGWAILWGVIGAVFVAAAFVLLKFSRPVAKGHRFSAIGLGVAAVFLLVAMFAPTLSAGGSDFGADVNYIGTTVNLFGTTDTTSWYDPDSEQFWDSQSVLMAQIALPLLALGVLVMLFATIVALTGRNGVAAGGIAAGISIAAWITLSLALIMDGEVDGTKWGFGFWSILIASVFTAGSGGLLFLGRGTPGEAGDWWSNPSEGGGADLSGFVATPAEGMAAAPATQDDGWGTSENAPPAGAMVHMTQRQTPGVAMAAATQHEGATQFASETADSAWGEPEPVPVRAACPQCGTAVNGFRGHAITCDNCGATGKLPA